jgi:hypothetical protein
VWEGVLQHFHYLDYNIVLNGKIIGVVNDEWERIWKEAVMAQSKHYSDICLVGLKKTTKEKPVSVDSVLVLIQTDNLLNTGLEYYHYTIPLSHIK